MIRSLLIGLVAGMRAMTPLAAVTEAASKGELNGRDRRLGFLANPVVAAGAKALAGGELWGDKLHSAPNRTILPGLIARALTGGLAGAAVAPRRQAVLGGLVGAAAAVAASYVTLALRLKAMERFGQTRTGLVEDAVVMGATHMVMSGARH